MHRPCPANLAHSQEKLEQQQHRRRYCEHPIQLRASSRRCYRTLLCCTRIRLFNGEWLTGHAMDVRDAELSGDELETRLVECRWFAVAEHRSAVDCACHGLEFTLRRAGAARP